MRYCRNIVFLICALLFIPLQSTHGHIILRGVPNKMKIKATVSLPVSTPRETAMNRISPR